MMVELSDVLGAAAVVFAAGGAWITLRQVSKRGADQGRRIGAIEIELAELRGIRRARTEAVPIAIDGGGERT
jgi:hypothetical protein